MPSDDLRTAWLASLEETLIHVEGLCSRCSDLLLNELVKRKERIFGRSPSQVRACQPYCVVCELLPTNVECLYVLLDSWACLTSHVTEKWQFSIESVWMLLPLYLHRDEASRVCAVGLAPLYSDRLLWPDDHSQFDTHFGGRHEETVSDITRHAKSHQVLTSTTSALLIAATARSYPLPRLWSMSP
jgi:hypothetical protein